jgi:sensor c-di-GMP phosphodiesterase-like protein
VIHPGGAGTTATALRAGTPQFIACTGCTALSGNDKSNNIERIQELGVSPKFGIYENRLKNITELMNDIEKNYDMYNENSKKVQENIQDEKGTENALTFIESMRKSYTVKFKIGDEVVYIGDNLRITGGFLTKSMVGKITSIHNENRDNSTYFVSFHGQKNTMTDNVYLARAVLKAKI